MEASGSKAELRPMIRRNVQRVNENSACLRNKSRRTNPPPVVPDGIVGMLLVLWIEWALDSEFSDPGFLNLEVDSEFTISSIG